METRHVFAALEANVSLLGQRITALEEVAKLTKKLIDDGNRLHYQRIVDDEAAQSILKLLIANGI